MRTFLLTWNPAKFDWHAFSNGVPAYPTPFMTDWTSHSTKPSKGDRFAMLRLGTKQNGIVATGEITSDGTYTAMCYDKCLRRFVDIQVDHLFLNAYPQHLLREKFPDQCWSPQSSGISLKDKYQDDFWNTINEFIEKKSPTPDAFTLMKMLGLKQ